MEKSELMFCYQCEQTAKGKGCEYLGICGKKPEVSNEQDSLMCEMISLAKVSEPDDRESIDLIVDGLFITVTNVSFHQEKIAEYEAKVGQRREKLGGELVIKPHDLFHGEENPKSLRSTLLFGLKGMAAYAHHTRILGKRDPEVDAEFINGMSALTEDHSVEEWLKLLMDFGHINLKCMEILDAANTEAYGNPVPCDVPLKIEKGPFIVITGHDLHDLKMLLEQTEGKGVNIYTHSEMLPAHGYPELKKYKHLKGNFGTAWQNQQKEFQNIPAPILFTTNCLMLPQDNYKDKVYTTSVVQFPGMTHVKGDADGNKDFSELIDHAIKLGGYDEDQDLAGINGGKSVTTGYGRQTVLDNAPAIIDAMKNGEIKHFFLVGGCDGARPGRNYYTEFVKAAPDDTVILTLACGKYRFNDYDAGKIGPFPRILDMGQCNDAYGAIKVALALADAFDCGVNDIPLSLVLSWYEQKAVCILLTLLALGIKNIHIGPSLPAFFSEDVLNTLVEMFDLTPISDPQEDLNSIMA